MWEWRIFWSTSVSCSGFDEPDIFLLLQRGRISNESPRRDDYVAVTSDIGLKWRGGRELEVKIRKEVDEASGAERWQKVISNCKTDNSQLDLKYNYMVVYLHRSTVTRFPSQ